MSMETSRGPPTAQRMDCRSRRWTIIDGDSVLQNRRWLRLIFTALGLRLTAGVRSPSYFATDDGWKSIGPI
jgi:hypothetical protein